ncbi:MAG TPA: polysaccharide deacetylase family protein [Vicinamibacteria bacterium]|nr:polysaccharide deacetylase family protein [Vicinamibacteria bacterium]
MALRRLGLKAREAWAVPRDLLLGRYPAFVTGGPLPRGHVPVFVFHSLEPASFARKLQYLADNDYVTLSATDYFQFLMGTRPAPPGAVVLTFDDGRGSLWSVGQPLLRRFGMKGIVFLVPGRVRSRPGPLPPTWDDVEARRQAPEAILGREKGEGALLSWEEIAALAPSGVFDFQSHTHTHARIHTAPRVAGFLTPEARHGYAAMDVPLVEVGGEDRFAGELPLGTPLLVSEPRTSESPRFYEDEGFRRACVDEVAAEGEGFFTRRDWLPRLRRLADRRPLPGRWESPSEREAALLRDLGESKRVIEERTGQPVVHLCYPWHVAGPTARRLAREVGYRTAFLGKVPGTPITLSGGDPMSVARIGEDYVELLPGRGRALLSAVLRRKWRRLRAEG